MLKNLKFFYNVLSFLRVHCSKMLSFFFINFFLSLFRACLLLKSLLSPLSLLLYHTISPKLHPLHLTISANSHHLLPIKLTKNTQTSQKITQKLNDKNLVGTIKLPFVNHTWNLEKTPLQSHRNPTKKPENQHRKIPKTSLKIPRKYQKIKIKIKKQLPKPRKSIL